MIRFTKSTNLYKVSTSFLHLILLHKTTSRKRLNLLKWSKGRSHRLSTWRSFSNKLGIISLSTRRITFQTTKWKCRKILKASFSRSRQLIKYSSKSILCRISIISLRLRKWWRKTSSIRHSENAITTFWRNSYRGKTICKVNRWKTLWRTSLIFLRRLLSSLSRGLISAVVSLALKQ